MIQNNSSTLVRYWQILGEKNTFLVVKQKWLNSYSLKQWILRHIIWSSSLIKDAKTGHSFICFKVLATFGQTGAREKLVQVTWYFQPYWIKCKNLTNLSNFRLNTILCLGRRGCKAWGSPHPGTRSRTPLNQSNQSIHYLIHQSIAQSINQPTTLWNQVKNSLQAIKWNEINQSINHASSQSFNSLHPGTRSETIQSFNQHQHQPGWHKLWLVG